MTEQTFAYSARKPDGAAVRGVIRAPDRRTALLRLEDEGVVPLSLREQASGSPLAFHQRGDAESDRLLVLQQIAVMTGAGIPLLEAVDSIADALAGRAIAANLAATATRLRSGDSIGEAFRIGLPFYPPHVHALVRVGEANGKLGGVLDEAVRQLRYEQTLRRDVTNALAYPAFLVVAAVLALGFLFAVVVPRFAEMIGPGRSDIDGLPGMVLAIGAMVDAYPLPMLAFAASLVALVIWPTVTPEGRRQAGRVLSEAPLIGDLVTGAHRAAWARVMALAVTAGVGILDAAALSFSAAPEGRFRDRLSGSIAALRSGVPIADAFGASGALDAIDMSLLRTGQTSGRLGAMFTVIADRHEADLRTAMKRLTAVIEQVAVALVALVIGVVVLGLVGAMASVYESIG